MSRAVGCLFTPQTCIQHCVSLGLCRKVLRMGEVKKTLSVALGGRRALEGEWGGQASMEPVPRVRHPEDTGPRASPPRPPIRAVLPGLRSAMTGVGGFGSRLHLCSSTIVALAVLEDGSSSAPLLSPPQGGLPGLARVAPPTLGTPSLTGSVCHCPELLACHPPLLPPTRRP